MFRLIASAARPYASPQQGLLNSNSSLILSISKHQPGIARAANADYFNMPLRSVTGSSTTPDLRSLQTISGEQELRKGIRAQFSGSGLRFSSTSQLEMIHYQDPRQHLSNTTFMVLGANGIMGRDFLSRLTALSKECHILTSQRSQATSLFKDRELNAIPSNTNLVVINAVGGGESFQAKYAALQNDMKQRDLNVDLIINISLHNPIDSETAVSLTPVKSSLNASTVITSEKAWSDYSSLSQGVAMIWAQNSPLAIHTINDTTGNIKQGIAHLCLMGVICSQRLVIQDDAQFSKMMSVLKQEIKALICSAPATTSALNLFGVAETFIDSFSASLSQQSEKDICLELIEQTPNGLNIQIAKETLSVAQKDALQGVLQKHGLYIDFVQKHTQWYD